MSFKKIVILIFICVVAFYLFYEKRGFFLQTLENIKFNLSSASLIEDQNLEKVKATLRVYNIHPSGEALALKKETKLLSKNDGVVYQTTENVIVPGIKNGEPGQANVEVIVYKKPEKELSTETTITIPGLSSTDYFQTTWAEVVKEETPKKEETPFLTETETLVSGIIYKDTIWELKNSPYIIYGNIFIPENVTLIIEPGVEVIIKGNYSFFIEGEIKMTGEKKSPATFFKNN